MILYISEVDDLTEDDLDGGFFVGWPSPPTKAQHLAVLRGSYRVVLARAFPEDRIVGFVNMISDGVLTGFIPWLEVLPEYQGRGIGSRMVQRILMDSEHLYSVDLACDESLRPFYERLGMLSGTTNMAVRNYNTLKHEA